MELAVRKYLAAIGRNGGKKSRRKLSSDDAKQMVIIREARRAFRRFHTECFGSFDKHYKIKVTDVPWVAEQLKKNGSPEAWEVANRLLRPKNFHSNLEDQSIVLHRAIARKIMDNSALLQVAKNNLARWAKKGSRSSSYFAKWDLILSKPVQEIADLIVLDSEEMRDMRQSSPFAGVLTPKERWKIYETFRTGTHH